jgi:hypothetical protein
MDRRMSRPDRDAILDAYEQLPADVKADILRLLRTETQPVEVIRLNLLTRAYNLIVTAREGWKDAPPEWHDELYRFRKGYKDELERRDQDR